MRRHGPPFFQGNDGFTLLEILVAISIMAICLTVILQLFSGGLKSGRLSEDYTRGVFHAREIMEEILLSDVLSEGVNEGNFNEFYAWKAEVSRVEQTEEEETKLPLDTYLIKVVVTWGETEKKKRFELETTKVLEKPKEEAGQ